MGVRLKRDDHSERWYFHERHHKLLGTWPALQPVTDDRHRVGQGRAGDIAIEGVIQIWSGFAVDGPASATTPELDGAHAASGRCRQIQNGGPGFGVRLQPIGEPVGLGQLSRSLPARAQGESVQRDPRGLEPRRLGDVPDEKASPPLLGSTPHDWLTGSAGV
jgi:hypothetical protein